MRILEKKRYLCSFGASGAIHVGLIFAVAAFASSVRSTTMPVPSGVGLPQGVILTDYVLDLPFQNVSSDSQASSSEVSIMPQTTPSMLAPSADSADSGEINLTHSKIKPQATHRIVHNIVQKVTAQVGISNSLISEFTSGLANISDADFSNSEKQNSPSGETLSATKTGIRFGPKPPYPQAARRAGFEGFVVLKVRVDRDGTPRSAEVAKSSGRDDCDVSARRTVENKWLFEPDDFAPQKSPLERVVVVQYALNG